MKLYTIKMIRAAFFGPALLLLASCGSYQYAGYENDGIYSSDNREAVAANEEEDSYGESEYYEQLFAEQSAQYEQLPQEGMIFTNIDAYSSTGAYDESAFVDEELAYHGGNAPWGEDVDEVSINIYSGMSPFYNRPHYLGGFYDPYWDYGYGGFYGHRWSPWGYGRYGYGHGYGFYSPWDVHFGWRSGYGHYNPYRYGHGYGGYISNPAYRYNNDRTVSYSRTGRNTAYNRDSGPVRSSSIVRSSRRDSYYNSGEVRADRTRSRLMSASRSLERNDRTYRTRSTRVESSKAPTRRSAVNRRSTNTRTETRSTRTTRSTRAPEVRRSTSTSRSSGTVRSAPTTRSSGTRSSGTRSSRSRGGRGN